MGTTNRSPDWRAIGSAVSKFMLFHRRLFGWAGVITLSVSVGLMLLSLWAGVKFAAGTRHGLARVGVAVGSAVLLPVVWGPLMVVSAGILIGIHFEDSHKLREHDKWEQRILEQLRSGPGPGDEIARELHQPQDEIETMIQDLVSRGNVEVVEGAARLTAKGDLIASGQVVPVNRTTETNAAGSAQVFGADELAKELDEVAQKMTEYLAAAQRNRSALPMELGGDLQEMERQFKERGEKARRSENETLAGLKERFLVRVSGDLEDLHARGALSDSDEQEILHSFTVVHWAERIPTILARLAQKLRIEHP
jgi:hypothetical protein